MKKPTSISKDLSDSSATNLKIFEIGLKMGYLKIEFGTKKFAAFANEMYVEIGEAIKPWLKLIYNGVRDTPGMEQHESEMDEYSVVKATDIDEILKEEPQEVIDLLTWAKERRNNRNSGYDPEMYAMGAEMAAYHIEAGSRKFADFAKRMVADLGEWVKPYLASYYEGARRLPEMKEYMKDLDTTEYVDNADIDLLLKPNTKEKPDTLIKDHNLIVKPGAQPETKARDKAEQIGALAWAKENKDKLIDYYIAEHGMHIDPNAVRFLFAPIGYTGINVEEFRDRERFLVEQIYHEILKRNPDAVVSFVIGIPGAGKSLLVNKFLSGSNIIFDSVMSGEGEPYNYIDCAVDRKIEIIIVHADPREAFNGTIDRGRVTGRFVPISYMLTACEVYKNIVNTLHEKYGDSIDISNFRRKGNEITKYLSKEDTM